MPPSKSSQRVPKAAAAGASRGRGRGRLSASKPLPPPLGSPAARTESDTESQSLLQETPPRKKRTAPADESRRKSKKVAADALKPPAAPAVMDVICVDETPGTPGETPGTPGAQDTQETQETELPSQTQHLRSPADGDADGDTDVEPETHQFGPEVEETDTAGQVAMQFPRDSEVLGALGDGECSSDSDDEPQGAEPQGHAQSTTKATNWTMDELKAASRAFSTVSLDPTVGTDQKETTLVFKLNARYAQECRAMSIQDVRSSAAGKDGNNLLTRSIYTKVKQVQSAVKKLLGFLKHHMEKSGTNQAQANAEAVAEYDLLRAGPGGGKAKAHWVKVDASWLADDFRKIWEDYFNHTPDKKPKGNKKAKKEQQLQQVRDLAREEAALQEGKRKSAADAEVQFQQEQLDIQRQSLVQQKEIGVSMAEALNSIGAGAKIDALGKLYDRLMDKQDPSAAAVLSKLMDLL